MKGCSFTGHRKISKDVVPRLEGFVMRAIEYAYGLGCRSFYCGGALGFDTMAAKAVILFRMRHSDVRLIIIAPCKEQSASWSARERDMYDYVMASADEIELVSDEYTPDCMRKRNERLAQLCDIMIAYSGKQRSGSGQTVRMAERLGKPVYNLFMAAETGS